MSTTFIPTNEISIESDQKTDNSSRRGPNQYVRSLVQDKNNTERKPPWLRVRLPTGNNYTEVKQLMRGQKLNTVCEEAMCPNIWECWSRGTATFLLMGEICTRSCGFCHIKTGRPQTLDEDEPRRVAESVLSLGLKHCVLTSVNRDELPNGGAHIFANTIREIRNLLPTCTVEVLIPDFKGDQAALQEVMDAKPEILNHNTETVPRLYRTVRPQADYQQTLEVLSLAKKLDPGASTKTGIMLGLGETKKEVIAVMEDWHKHDVDILTLGQYLRPSPFHLPIDRYAHPDEFQEYHDLGKKMGFKWVESGPLVRSSYHADGQVDALQVVGRG
ncbi:lipoyl synthase [Anaerolineales bacterium HSG6]|nr:lipoyl synthase [Anaerolineales bacterium HSG6]MDM8531612.1 lipoyl synthase [Anaerolineales bacterium HSG25]